MKKSLILIGGGGHCKSVIDVVESTDYNILGILDTKEKIGNTILSYPILGCDDDIQKYVGDAFFLITVGFINNPGSRLKLIEKLKTAGASLATVIASTASFSKHARIGAGSVIMHNAVVNADAVVGENCIINTFANIEHDSTIGNNCHISTGAMVNGGCAIGDNVFVGSQSVLSQGVFITDDSIIGAACFVNKDISTSGVYSGNPARKIK